MRTPISIAVLGLLCVGCTTQPANYAGSLNHSDRKWQSAACKDGRQKAESYEPPVWPPEPGKQGMQMHIEVEVDDLAAAVEHAVELGARVAEHQPQENVRVMLDPAGHPFCLYT